MQGFTLVTGASRRIGLALASALLADGERVVAHSRAWDASKVQAFAEVTGARAEGVWQPWAADFLHCVPALPAEPITRLVLNASMFGRGCAWKGSPATPEEATLMRQHLQVNVLAQWELALAVAARGELESIVMVLDTYYDRPLPGHAAYQVSRAAGAGLVRALAAELAPVRVNAVAPGTVLWSERPIAERAESVECADARTVLGHVGEPADVVHAVRYLLSAAYVTGEVLRVDGGRWKA